MFVAIVKEDGGDEIMNPMFGLNGRRASYGPMHLGECVPIPIFGTPVFNRLQETSLLFVEPSEPIVAHKPRYGLDADNSEA